MSWVGIGVGASCASTVVPDIRSGAKSRVMRFIFEILFEAAETIQMFDAIVLFDPEVPVLGLF